MIHKSIAVCFVLSFFIVGCDVVEQASEPQFESRTMIIGGVPVHDKDYKLSKD